MKLQHLLENDELDQTMTQQGWPKGLQAEMYDEWVATDPEGIDFVRSLELLNKSPVTIPVAKLLKNKDNLEAIGRCPQDVIDFINDKWKVNVQIGPQYSQNPERYFQYAKMSGSTAKPSIIIDDEVAMGVGRFIAALIRGDNNIQAWLLKRR